MNVLKSSKQTFWHGALLLAVAGLLSKILSAVYRVPFQNIVGDVGFYIYQQVYPFYGIALALSLYGFPVVISKMMLEEKGGQSLDRQSILAISFCFLMVIGLVIFIGLYQFSSEVANMMGDRMLQKPIEMVSFSFLLIPVISVLRGFFQGNENMLPTALSQIAEQFIRVVTIIIVAYLLVLHEFTLYEVGAGAVFGSLTGGFAAIAILLIFQMRNIERLSIKQYKPIFTLHNIKRFPYKNLILNSLAICLTGLTLVLLQMVDSFTLYNQLLYYGLSSEEAKVSKGVFDRGQPLLQLGVVLATSLSLSLVPAIAKAKQNGEHTHLLKHARIALKISLVVGTGATIGLIAIMKYTNHMLFTNINGSQTLSILVISILFTSVSLTALAILQGLGLIKQSAWFILMGVGVKWILNALLVPLYGSMGAAIATVLSVFVIAICSLILLYRVFKRGKMLQPILLGKIVIAGALMFIFVKLYEWLFFTMFAMEVSRITSTYFAISAALMGGVAFIVLILALRTFNKDEISDWSILKKRIKS
ncbi:PST family polysaccharide transporter [Bacillus mesophilus]|uniref:Polysaccharide biosynthesis protein n=1 Tax=Bacillus mesophilus TaxID=1808955 RepID=A0A6M0QCM9_9BACI|nr:polysaccharide biosynthesis protein [Bacillus mesophilus]MBM7663428.1 PST family polysaccharide transporter [Bacillus mesophilus]NEY74122.1 polysaccharide biosynthesis protein [Bacillus mesophilus]